MKKTHEIQWEFTRNQRVLLPSINNRQIRDRGERDRDRKTETKTEVYKEKKFLGSIHNNIKMYQIPEGKILIDALFTIPARTKTVQRRDLKC